MIWLKIVGRRGQFNFLLTKFSPLNWRVVDGRGRCYSRVRQKHSCFTLLFDGLCSDSELYLLAPRKSTQSGVQNVRKGQEAGQCLASRFYSLGPKKTSRKMPKRKVTMELRDKERELELLSFCSKQRPGQESGTVHSFV